MEFYDEVGRKRLARVFDYSYKEIQSLSLRDIEEITRRLYAPLECGVSKDTSGSLRRAATHYISSATLDRLAPLIFRVKYFLCVDNDPVGRPVFTHDLQKYDKRRKNELRCVNTLKDLMRLDGEARYSDWKELLPILDGRIPVIVKQSRLKSVCLI